MADDEWVVVKEHLLPVGWVMLDGPGMEMLAIEAALSEEGIAVCFDPFRPGEAGGFTRTVAQPIRMLVKDTDVSRAREIAAEFDESPESREADE